MATYSEYDEIISQKLANTSELFFDENMKRQEINNTLLELTNEYALPELKKKATITFDALGKASKPADYQKMIKLYDVATSGIQSNEYSYLPESDFDSLATTAGYYWTEDYDTVTDLRKLMARPIDCGTLQIRYYKTFTTLSDSASDSGINSMWNECVALGATYRLLKNAGRYDEAGLFQEEYNDKKLETYLRVKKEGGVKGNNRFRSKYERVSQLQNNNSLWHS